MRPRKPIPEVELAEKMQDFVVALNIVIADVGNEKRKTIDFRDIKTAVNSADPKASISLEKKNSKTRKEKLKTIAEKTTSITQQTPEKDIIPLYADAASLIPPGLEVSAVGNNNLNFIVRDPGSDTKIVIQLSKKQSMKSKGKQVDEMLSKNFSAMAVDYGKPIFTPTIERDLPPKKHYNSYSQESMMSIRCMEYCPKSISQAVKESKSEAEKLILALQIATQTSELLTQLSKKNIIWTDLKNGNILLRSNNKDSNKVEIVITDTKGFLFKDEAFVFYNDKTNKFTVPAPAITKALCSKAEAGIGEVNGSASIALPKGLTPAEKKEKLKANAPAIEAEAKNARTTMMAQWEKEYSYQMAVLIYFTLTGQNKYREEPFDFKTPAFNFNTPEGAQMKKLIEQLSHDNPDDRMTHQAAIKVIKQSPELGNIIKQTDAINKAAVTAKSKSKPIKLVNPLSSSSVDKPKIEKRPDGHMVAHHDTTIIHDPTAHVHHTKPNPNTNPSDDKNNKPDPFNPMKPKS